MTTTEYYERRMLDIGNRLREDLRAISILSARSEQLDAQPVPFGRMDGVYFASLISASQLAEVIAAKAIDLAAMREKLLECNTALNAIKNI